MQDFEKLGVFYLGREFDIDKGKTRDNLVLYDSKDLTTHAVCVGMTGSGKTGLCMSVLEEAAIDGIPTIAIDPKGDLGNLMLTFPKLQGSDFRPWIDDADSARSGMTPDDYAARTAETWRNGLAAWGEDGARIARFQAAADVAIYTPGSTAGIPLTVLRSFAAPPPALASDAEALRDRILSAVSGLLALVGIKVDPIRSREHILLSNIMEKAWSAGRDLDLATLIREIQAPPFDRVGVFELEAFYPASERFALAMTINNLLASPGFSAWLQGEPLDIGRLLYTPQGKPRIAILSIAHLGDAERMFFVTILLNEVIAWMRTQPGTASLRALLYMDEIFGYFPPTAEPPSKAPMLMLLKQARAFGLGLLLATQNPVDLDYKGLSNAGTWFIGRLQTERDKLRVLDGLEGVAATSGTAFDRARMDTVISGLGSRVFLMHNVHEDAPVLFQTRWLLSYLRGPLTRSQIQTLMEPRKRQAGAVAGAAAAGATAAGAATPAAAGAANMAAGANAGGAAMAAGGQKPVVPPDIPEVFVAARPGVTSAGSIHYKPRLLGTARLHYVEQRSGLDTWQTATLLAPIDEDSPGRILWDEATAPDKPPEVTRAGIDGARYAPMGGISELARAFSGLRKAFTDALYRGRALRLLACPALGATSAPGEEEGAFRARLLHSARERRDVEIEKLRATYAPKVARLQEQVRALEQRKEREQSQYRGQQVQTAISMGATILGALFGRKTLSSANVGRAATVARGAGRTVREREDVTRAEDNIEAVQAKLALMDEELKTEIARIQEAGDPTTVELKPIDIPPRKSDTVVEQLALAWTPWRLGEGSTVDPLF